MRVLFVTGTPPERLVSGGGTATSFIIDVLRAPPIGAVVDVTTTEGQFGALAHRPRQSIALACSMLSRLPSKTLFDLPPGAVARIARQARSGDYGLAVINGGQLFGLAEHLPRGLPRLGIAHNVEHRLFLDLVRARGTRSVLDRLLARDALKLERLEREGALALGRLICLSSDDAATFQALEPEVRTLALPTGFVYPPHRRKREPVAGRPLRLGFLAKYSWWPNAEAVEWFMNAVLPGLSAGTVELNLFGPGAERFAGRHAAVRPCGYVPNLATVWDQSDLIVCPMRSGSGINIKFIEAIYNGCPVLATPLTARGLGDIRDPAVVFLEGAQAWIEFLRGPDALALATRSPAEALSERFSARHAGAALESFLS